MVTKRVEVYNPEGDLVYPKTTADVVQLVDAGNKFTSENVEDALQEVGTSLAGKAATNQSFYLGTTNISINRASGNIALTGISTIDGLAYRSGYLVSYDTRFIATTPETVPDPYIRADFKQNTIEGLSDGGTHFGELTFRPYGSITDWSGGPSHQMGFTYNGNVHHRWGTSTTWGSWYKFWDSNNFDPTTKADLAGATFSGAVTATTFTGSGAGLTSIPNTALTNSKVTIGTTNVALGGSSTSFAGLTLLAFASGASRGIRFDYSSLGSLYSGAGTMLGNNVYINPSDTVSSQVRIMNTHATYGYGFYKQEGGSHTWYGATGSVTADDIVSPVSQMTLTPTGLTVYGTIVKNGGTSAQFLKADGSVDATTYVVSNGALGTPTSGTLTNCTFPTLNQNTTGSAAKLTTARTIALSTGVTGTATNFDGSANITIPVTAVAASYLSGTIPASVLGNSTVYIGSTAVALNRATGSLALTGIASIDGSSASCTGNAATATKLAASKTIALSGDVTGTATAFDGSANITLTTALSDTSVTDALLTNYVVGTNTALTSSNSILTAFQNTQAQINAKLNATAQAADSAKLGGTAAASYALASAIPAASSAIPAMSGAGAAGTGTTWARADHIHPTDTTRQAAYPLLTTFGSLASAAGWLYNNGSGTLSYSSPTKSTVGLANVENTALSTWVGTSNITTLGTIATGIWHGTALADAYIASAATWNAKQAAYTILTTFGSLANAAGWLYNNGSGTLSYATPTAAQVGADASGAATSAVSTHAALQTGVHGISVTSGKTFSCSNTLTLAGTDSSTLNIGAGGTLGTGAFTAAYSLPTATSSVLGGVKPDGTSILNLSGVLSATPTSIGALASATNDNATSTACYPVWVTAAGNTVSRISASTFTFIPSTGTLNITTLQATGNVIAYNSSDSRLKENIAPLDSPLEKLSKIRGVSFDWTDAYIAKQGGEDGFFVRKHDVGVIAQEIQKVIPEAVGEHPDGYLGVRYEKLVPLLIEAIKAQQVQIDDLKKQIARLA